jgi:hypothetical protein
MGVLYPRAPLLLSEGTYGCVAVFSGPKQSQVPIATTLEDFQELGHAAPQLNHPDESLVL